MYFLSSGYNQYELADDQFRFIDNGGFNQILASEPTYSPSASEKNALQRLSTIRDFQQRSIDLFRNALAGNVATPIKDWLLNDLAEGFRENYHLALDDRHYTVPMFFRTDEGSNGQILEIQAPGSLWGEAEVLSRLWMNQYPGSNIFQYSLSQRFVEVLQRTHPEVECVQHLLDNASAQPGMRYFINCTRPKLRYYGYDRGVTVEDCQLVRSHSFYGLCAEDLFRTKLSRVGDGVYFDSPPHALFDQKACLVLPFWSLTRSYFDDSTRDIFPFTTPVLPSGVELPDGSQISLEVFSSMPRSQRRFFLKYAGVDTNRNWGSRSVFRLSNFSKSQCISLLQRVTAGCGRKDIWLIQAESSAVGATRFFNRDGSEEESQRLHVKYSSFFGPGYFLGAIAQYRKHYKVHGQPETIVAPLRGERFEPENSHSLNAGGGGPS